MKSENESQKSIFFNIIIELITDFLKKNKKEIAIYTILLFVGTTLSIVGITKLSAAMYKEVSDNKRSKAFKLFYIIIFVSLTITFLNLLIDKKENSLAPKFRSHVVVSLTDKILNENDKKLYDILPIRYRRFVSSTSHASYYLFSSIIRTYVPNAILLIIMLLFLLKLDKAYFFIFVIAIIICFLIFKMNQDKLVLKASTAEKKIRDTDNFSFDILSSLNTVISRGMHLKELDKIKNNVKMTEDLIINFNHFTDKVNYSVNFLVAIIIFLIMALALHKIGDKKQTVSILAALSLMQTLRTKLVGLSSTNVAAINEYSKAKSNTLNELYTNILPNINENKFQYKIQDNPIIEFKNICFKYDNTTKKVLDDFNFKIDNGETFNILKGNSGSGKSTACKLLLKLYNAQEGDILIDGQSIRQISNQELRKNIIFLNQDLNILNRSIYDIINYGNNATLEQVTNQFSNISKYFQNKTLSSYVGRNGEALSSGQKMILRILNTKLSSAKVIILDEPTTGMNDALKMVVLNMIRELNNDKTILIISHSMDVVDYFSSKSKINLKDISV